MAEREHSPTGGRSRATTQRTTGEGAPQPAAGSLADHQAAIGNQALQQRLSQSPTRVQAKLDVSGPEDAHEREADRVAAMVTAMPDPIGQRQSDTDDVDDLDDETIAPRLDRQADADDLEELDEDMITPKAAQTPTVTPDTESAINRSRGGGHPLDTDTRRYFEPRLDRDLSDVKAHTDPSAARLASDMGAQAFTVGRDIYFAEGRYQPGTATGRSLLAHELTHTIQQQPNSKHTDPSAARTVDPIKVGNRVQRATEDTADENKPPPADPGRVDTTSSTWTIRYATLRLPDFKFDDKHRRSLYTEAAASGKLRHAKDFDRGSPGQRKVWRDALNLKKMRGKIEKQLKDTYDPNDRGRVYILKHEESSYRMVGNFYALARQARFPAWSPRGKADPKDVDHIVELQVSGWQNGKTGAKGWDAVNTTKNMELLDNRANTQSGGAIDEEINRLVKGTADYYWQPPGKGGGETEKAVTDAVTADPDLWGAVSKPKPDDVKERYDLVFEGVAGGLPNQGDPTNRWTFEEVDAGDHLKAFKPVSDAETDSKWEIYPLKSGGIPERVETGSPEDEGPTVSAAMKDKWFAPFTVLSYELEKDAQQAAGGEEIGRVTLMKRLASTGDYYALFKGGQDGADADVDILRLGDNLNAGYLKDRNLKTAWLGLSARDPKELQAEVEGASPVEFQSVALVPGEGFLARGQLLPDVPIMADLAIDLVVEGDAVYLAKRFDVGDFDLPGPIEITHSTVEMTAGTNGLGANGDLGVAIEGVGDGLVTARIDTESGFALSGSFTFDPELFDPPSRIELGYEDGEFSGAGLLTIGENRVRGIKTASINASYADGRLKATGDAELDVPGLERGTMTLSYSEAEGFAIGGSFDVSSDVPGISSGSVSAEVRHDPEDGYAISASGTAVPDIPGVSARVDVAYEDGIFTAEGTAAYERGMLSGSLAVGATNEVLDDDGEPTGEAGDTLRAFGGGELTLQLAPWLEASASVRLTAEGEVEVTGQVGLPAALEVFSARRYDRNLFAIDLDVPIVGVAVAGQRIGVFATVGGGLDLTAGFGPGELRDLSLEVVYNPDREEDTEVTGGAEFVVPADAGLRLFVRGALGAGIPVVSASAGLEVGGGLGIEGAVSAGVEVAWTPTDGIELDAEAEIFAEPTFAFDITGFVDVEADLLLKTIELYSERWQLAGFEYGSGLQLGATFPIHYVEGEPFDVAMDDIEFQVPDIDPQALLTDLVDELT